MQRLMEHYNGAGLATSACVASAKSTQTTLVAVSSRYNTHHNHSRVLLASDEYSCNDNKIFHAIICEKFAVSNFLG